MSQPPPYVANLIAARMVDLGWTQIRLAEEAGVTCPALNRALQSGRMSSTTADRLIKALGGLRHQSDRNAAVWGDPP